MNCNVGVGVLDIPKVTGGLFHKYFSGLSKVTKKSIDDVFMGRSWESDEDGFKLVNLYFAHFYLLATPLDRTVFHSNIDISYSADFDNFS